MNAFEVFNDAEGKAFATLVGAVDPSLLDTLRNGIPDRSQRISVMRILSDAFMTQLGPDWEPNRDGAAIDNLLGAFLKAWPIDDDRADGSGRTAKETG